MNRLYLFVVLLFVGGLSHAQYWFGPKVGFNRNDFIYRNDDYASDTVRVPESYNFELGGVVVYQATDLFSVQGEVYYERMRRRLTDRPPLGTDVTSSANYHFLTVPMMFRVSFGKQPIHYYVDGGIKMRFWMGGHGRIDAGEPEFGDAVRFYDRIVFQQSKSDPEGGTFAVKEANIMQFGLAVGGGVYLDLITNGRLLLDFKYGFGHSNMGFNGNPDFTDDVTGYTERFTFRSNTLSISLAYLFEFDVKEQKHGKSTSSETQKSRKSHKK